MKREAISLTLSPDVLRTVGQIATEEARSRSWIVDRACREWLAARAASPAASASDARAPTASDLPAALCISEV